MNINIIIGIIFVLAIIFSFVYLLIHRSSQKKRQRKMRIIEEKANKPEKKIYYNGNKGKNESEISDFKKEEIKKRIIIKKSREEKKSEQKDLISEAISELDDLSATKLHILNGNRNMTNMVNIERDNSPLKILVVDDSRLFLKKAKQALLSSGENYDITTAIDGKEALHHLKKEMFDLIVTDMDMPEMDGAELIKIIKDDLVLSKIPVIVVTGQPKLITNGLENKVLGVLEKPYEENDLLYQAQNALFS